MASKHIALILDWGKGPILDHMAASMDALGYEVVRRVRSPQNIPDIVQTIQLHYPKVCVTRQRFYEDMQPVSDSLSTINCQTLFVDLGVWPHYQTYIMDPAGDNASSSLVGRIRQLEASPGISSEADKHLEAVEQMKRDHLNLAAKAETQLRELGLEGFGTYSLLILQREGDEVLVRDAPARWRNPCVLARDAIAEAARTNSFVVVKPHPMSKLDLGLPREGPNHRVVPGFKCGKSNDLQLAWLMLHAKNAVMVNSTCHFQTLSLGRPTICLGRGWFSENDVVVEASDLQNVLCTETAKPSERYLCHVMSRQMKVPQFSDPQSLDRLMKWLMRCEDAVSRRT